MFRFVATLAFGTLVACGNGEFSDPAGSSSDGGESSALDSAETDTDADGDAELAYPGYPYQSNFVTMDDGLQMHYLDEGSGDETIVMVHGLPTQAYMWRRVIPSVSELGRTLAIDLMNFGRSDKTEPLSPGQQAAYLTQFIEKLGLENVTLVLHDWGVAIGLKYATEHTENVKRVVFFEGPFAPIEAFSTVPEFFVRNVIDPATAAPKIIQDNWFIECFVLDPACGATSRMYTEDEKQVYREPFLTEASRQQILYMPQFLPFMDATGHPVLDPDGPGGAPAKPVPELDYIVANAQWLATSATPKLMIYGQPGTFAGGNPGPVVAKLEASHTNLSTVQVGSEMVDNFHYIAEDTPQELADAIVRYVKTH